jgi:hypothetical protein
LNKVSFESLLKNPVFFGFASTYRRSVVLSI